MAELRSGIQLRAGHSVVVVVSDLRGTPRPESGEDKPALESDEPVEPPPPDTVRAAFDAAHFETNKAFPLKDALPTFRKVASFANQNPDRNLVVVGHTDTVGDHSPNLLLSRERAQSIQAYLHDDVDVWMNTFYKKA